MDLDQLKAFRAIARKQNISQAARDLFISQSALSKTLTGIEAELGISLFERNGAHLKITEYGEILLHYADVSENALSEAESLIQKKKDQRDNAIRIIFRVPLGSPVAIFETFMKEHPSATPHIATESEVREDFDLEVFSANSAPNEAGIVSICDNPMALIVSNGHPLAKSPKPVEIKQLKHERFIGYQPFGKDLDLERECQACGFSPNYVMAHQQVSGLLEYVKRGCACFGPFATWLNGSDDSLVPLPVNGIAKASQLFLSIKTDNPSNKVSDLARLVMDNLRSSRQRQEKLFPFL